MNKKNPHSAFTFFKFLLSGYFLMVMVNKFTTLITTNIVIKYPSNKYPYLIKRNVAKAKIVDIKKAVLIIFTSS